MTITIDRMKRARTQLGFRNPFFSFLSYYLQFEKMQRQSEEQKGIAVSDDGILYYDEEYVSTLTEEQLIGVICHEVLHLGFSHLLRRKDREKNKWDLATDISVNSILAQNRFQLPHGAIVPEQDAVMLGNTVITNVSKKTAEQLYDEIPNQKNKKQGGGGGQGQGKGSGQGSGQGQGNGKGNGKGDGKGNGNNKGDGQGSGGGSGQNRFDDHIENNKQSQSQNQEKENQWKQRLSEAMIHSKNRGTIPLGMDRMYQLLFEEQINWQALLQRYIQRMLPVDYTWARPNKKSIAIGTYMPDVVREKIDLVVAIDASGSISPEELATFLSEIRGMAKAYRNRLTVRVLSHDVIVHTDETIDATRQQDLSKIKIKGGGGTSHLPVMEFINKKVRLCKVAVFFTDGYSDLQQVDFRKNGFNSIIVLSKNGTDQQLVKHKGLPIIRMKGGPRVHGS